MIIRNLIDGPHVKNGQLKQKMAEAMRIPEQTAEVTMRIIREAGLMTTGPRGVNAPHMTYLDAARTLIAQIVEDNPGRRAEAYVKEIGSLPWGNPAGPFDGDSFTLQALHPAASLQTFEQALAAMIEVFATLRQDPRMIEAGTRKRGGDWQKPLCTVEIWPSDHWARIYMGSVHYDFGNLELAHTWAPEKDERFRLGRQARCFINQEVIACLADGFAEGEA